MISTLNLYFYNRGCILPKKKKRESRKGPNLGIILFIFPLKKENQSNMDELSTARFGDFLKQTTKAKFLEE